MPVTIDGTSRSLVIGNGRMEVVLLAAGASVQSVRLAGIDHDLVVGARDPAAYGQANRAFLGATIGRNANRIAGGRLPIGEEIHQLSINEAPHHLHGGTRGFWSRDWRIDDLSASHCVMRLEAAVGEDGYPGNVGVSASFEVVEELTLSILYAGQVDRPGALNMTPHLYFNLSGQASTQDHTLQIDADAYLPVDAGLIPTGVAAPVEASLFDFRVEKRLGDGPPLLDHNFCLSGIRTSEPRRVARLASPATGLAVDVATTECGLQVYDGTYLDGSIEGLNGRPIMRHGAVALEPQAWPDWPNRPAFAGGLLLPGATYRHHSLYRFQHAR